MNSGYQSIIIIGAPRSGTSMLRDLLTQLPGCGTWACDEIDYIWRHGNRSYPTDELPPTLATTRVSKYIRRAFVRLANSRRFTTIVEKTCANSLRVPFVDSIFPDAQFVHLVRDGRDVAVSANERWRATSSLPYLLKRARFVPASDLPFYTKGFLADRLSRLLSTENKLRTWGPKYSSLKEDLRHGSLLEVCALQWKQCVDSATEAFANIDPQRVHTLRYEDFVRDPAEQLFRLADSVGLSTDQNTCRSLTSGVRTSSLGRAANTLDAESLTTIEALCEEALKAHDYELFCEPESPRLYLEGEGGAARHPQGARRRAG